MTCKLPLSEAHINAVQPSLVREFIFALDSKNIFTSRKLPKYAAHINGEKLPLSGSAPCSSNNFVMSSLFIDEAQTSGVSSSPSEVSTLAPFSTNTFTSSEFCCFTACIKGVYPLWSSNSKSSPKARNLSTSAKFPFFTACINVLSSVVLIKERCVTSLFSNKTDFLSERKISWILPDWYFGHTKINNVKVMLVKQKNMIQPSKIKRE